ncbi:hypothetical protein J2W83_003896 [Pseudomonas hunanensis]|uniref:Uncharacterized protein n=1 Tax=Pseudomonas hunanensis TaxID=1247546 RepID=A0ACC6K7A3_9PSED|nr:hypothetical protein [Pseudomonas hunanensis]
MEILNGHCCTVLTIHTDAGPVQSAYIDTQDLPFTWGFLRISHPTEQKATLWLYLALSNPNRSAGYS